MGFKERLKKEQVELKEKILKLEGFLESGEKKDVSDYQETLLRHQLLVMYPYIDILQIRMYDLDIEFLPY